MAILHGGSWSTLVNFYSFLKECSIKQIGFIFSTGIGHPANDVHIMLDTHHFEEIFGSCNRCSFGVKRHSPGVRGEIIVEGNNIFKLLVRRNREGFQIRVHQLKGLGSTSFIFWESLIGHLAKSTSRANTVLSRKVNLQEVLHMLLCVSEDFLTGVPESLVHNVIIDFAHGGDIVRSNYRDRSNPKNDVVIVFWVWPKP